jgi:hypothetical protein
MARVKSKKKNAQGRVDVDRNWIEAWEAFYNVAVDETTDDLVTRLAVIAAHLAEDRKQFQQVYVDALAAVRPIEGSRKLHVSIDLPEPKPKPKQRKR